MHERSCTLNPPRAVSHSAREEEQQSEPKLDLAAIVEETLRDEKYRDAQRELARRRNESCE